MKKTETIHELEQYRSLCSEIRILSGQLRTTQHGCSVVKGSETDFPYIERRFTVLGCEDVMKDEEKLRRLIERCRSAKRRAEIFVNDIPDSEIRSIFRLRYLYGRQKPSWQEIAFKIGKHDESYPRRKHDAYLRKNGRD